MTNHERAAEIWAILVLAARHQELISYKTLERMTGHPRNYFSGALGLIQEHCKRKKLPPLTALVVLESTGLPGSGFNAANRRLLAQARVFVFDWLEIDNPFGK